MLLKIAISFALLTLLKAECIQENVYEYEGFLSVGSEKPEEFISFSNIGADLHVLKQPNDEYFMQLKNVNFSAFSGKKSFANEDDTTHWVPITEESEAITLPFIYNMYTKKGEKGITTSKSDLPWSRNVKKAIADLFFNDKRIFEQKTQTFHSDDGFTYHVLNMEKNLRVVKTMSDDMYKRHAQETNDYVFMDEYYPLPMFRKFNYEYDQETKDVKSIVAVSNVDYNPLNGISESFYVFVNQSLIFKEKMDSCLENVDQTNMAFTEVDFSMDAYFTGAGGLDLSKGRTDIDMDKTVKDLIRDLKNTFDYLNKSHITLKKTLVKDDEHIDSVIRRMKYLDEAHLEDLYKSLADDEDLSEILLQIVPILGTPASCSFIVDMVTAEKIKGEAALDALSNLPTRAIVLPLDLKNKLTNLIKNSPSPKIYNQAILTLSNMVSKFVHKPGYEYVEVVENFIEKLKKATEEHDQLLYIYALRNIRSNKTIDELIQIARGSKGYEHITRHSRAESLYGLERTSKGEETLWLLFANKKEEFEIRASAMNNLLIPEKPKNLDKMFWLLKGVTDDEELKHFFATKLKMFSEIDLDRYEKLKIRALALNLYFEGPTISYARSMSEMFDFTVAVGFATELTYYGRFLKENFTVVQLKMATKTSAPVTNNEEYHFYAENVGISEISFSSFMDKMMEWSVDMVVIKDGRVLSYRPYNVHDAMEYVSEHDDDTDKEDNKYRLKTYLMDQEHADEILIPTDMGIPVVFRHNAGFIGKLDVLVNKAAAAKSMFDFVYRGSEIYGFTSYNPISNTWSGVKRVMTLDLKMPLDVDYRLNVEQNNIKVTLNKNEEASGFQSFVYSQVYLRDSSNGEVLKKACPKCEMDNLVEGGDGLEGYVYLDNDDENTGSRYKMAVYDCDQRVTWSYLSIINLDPLWNLVMASPNPGMCGVGFMVEPSEKYPATHLELTLRTVNNNVGDFAKFDTVKMVYNVKNGDKLSKSWNINFSFARHNKSMAEGLLTAVETKKGSPTYKFCLNTSELWQRDYWTSKHIITSGIDESDEKCPKAGSLITINGLGKASEEMITSGDPEQYFTSCSGSFHECLKDISSLRHYVYDITYQNITPGFEDFYMKISDLFRNYYSNEFVRMRTQPGIAENQIKIIVDYPLYYKSVNISVLDHFEAYRYDDILIETDLKKTLFSPYSVFNLDNMGRQIYCEAGKEYVANDPDDEAEKLEYEDWTILAEMLDQKNETVWMIKMKNVGEKSDDVIVNIRNGKEVVELSYENDFVLKVNGEVMKMEPNQMMAIGESLNVLMTRQNENNQRVFVNMVHKGVTLEYVNDRVRMSLVPGFTGSCKTPKAKSSFGFH